MKLVNVSLNVIFGSLSIVCLSGIAYAVVVGSLNIIGLLVVKVINKIKNQ